MGDRIDDLGRDASAAVRDETEELDLRDGLGDVVRRSRRRRVVVPIVTTAVLALLAVPAVGWLLDATGGPQVEVADAPPGTDDTADPVPADEDDDAAVDEGDVPDDDGVPGTGDDRDDGGTLDRGQVDDEGTDDEVADGEGSDGSAPTGPRPVGEFGLEEVATDGFPAGGEGVAELTDVRMAGQDGFDRIVLEFAGDDLGPYRVAYTDPPVVQDGSGAEVDLAGEAFLEIRLTAASGAVFDADAADGYRLTYDGPDRLESDTATVTELVRTGDFEATLTWTAGLDERAPFAVTVLEAPLRLVVDVQTG